jgi:RNA polymerase sigma-70 factor (ECF subfamily)
MFNEKGNIKKAKEGDKQAMALLYKDHFKPLYIFVRSKVNTNEQAEDLCSEVFIKAFESLKNFKEESSFKTWIYGIAKNLVFDFYRRNKNLKTTELEENLEDKSTDNDNTSSKLNKYEKMIKALLNKLPENYRQVLELRFLLNYNIKETAEIMKLKPNNVKVLQNRAIRKARELNN